MRRFLALAALSLLSVMPAQAIDLPTRKAGLWELKMEFDGRTVPAQVMKQCVDAASDKMMNTNFAGGPGQSCSKQDVTRSGSGFTVDSVCTIGGATTTTHAVVSGSFDSAYSIDVTSKREGGPPMPGSASGATHMKIDAKWLGVCAAGQKPGDVIMGNGMTMNVLEMQRMRPPPPR